MKNKTLKLISLALLAFAATASANNCRDSWYLSGAGSFNTRSDSTYELGHNFKSKADYKNGFGASIALGREIEQFRFELEYAYRQAKHKSNVRKWSIDDDEFHIFMLNGYYDICLCNNFSLYLGIGSGVATRNSEAKSKVLGNEDSLEISGALWAAQAMGGLTYTVSPCVDLFTGYRYIFVDGDGIASSKMPNVHLNTIEAGLRFKF